MMEATLRYPDQYFVKIAHEDMRQHCSYSEVDIHPAARQDLLNLREFSSNCALM
jgi:hypothetical protein